MFLEQELYRSGFSLGQSSSAVTESESLNAVKHHGLDMHTLAVRAFVLFAARAAVFSAAATATAIASGNLLSRGVRAGSWCGNGHGTEAEKSEEFELHVELLRSWSSMDVWF